MADNRVTVIIPVKDDTERLKKCLTALIRQTYPPALFDVIIVDNNSALPVPPDIGADMPFSVRVIKESYPSSYAARNTGIRAAKGDILVFTDSDCIPHPEWLEKGVTALTANPDVPFIAGKVEVVMSESPTSVELYESITAFPQKEYVENSGFGVTANLFVTRRIMEKTGYFNHIMQSGADREWGNRASSGGKGMFSPDAVIFHPARKTWHQLETKVDRTIKGYCELAFSRSVPWAAVIRESAGDLMPLVSLMKLFLDKRYGLYAKLKISRVMIKVKWRRTFRKIRWITGKRD